MTGLYDYNKKLESAINKIEQGNLSIRNKRLILGFKDDCVIRGLSKPRIVKCLDNLKKLAEWLKKEFIKYFPELSNKSKVIKYKILYPKDHQVLTELIQEITEDKYKKPMLIYFMEDIKEN